VSRAAASVRPEIDFGRAEQRVELRQQADELIGLRVAVQLADRVRADRAGVRGLLALGGDVAGTGEEHELQPLRERHRVGPERPLELELLRRQGLLLPVPDALQLGLDLVGLGAHPVEHTLGGWGGVHRRTLIAAGAGEG